MKQWFSVVMLGCGLVFSGFGAAVADENVKSDPPVSSLEDVVVTASRAEEPKKELSTHVTVIDEQAIKISSARNVGELLAERAGIMIRQYPGTLTTIGIRGFRTETHGNDLKGHVLVLLDGRRTATGNLAKLMTTNVERVEIIRGPGSVQYGSAAVGGVINVITKRGKDKPEVSVEGMLGSYGYEEVNAGFSGKIEQFDFSGSVGRRTMDDYDTGDGDKFRNTGVDEEISVSLNAGFEFMPGNRLGIVYTNFDADGVGNPGYQSQNDEDDYKDTSNDSVDFVYDGRTESGMISWKARYFTGEDKDKWVNRSGSDPDGWDAWSTEPSEMETDSEGAQAQISLNWDYATLTAGMDWVNYDIKATWTPNKTEYDNMAGFVLGKLRLLEDRLILNAGLRYDEYEVEVKEPAGKDEDDDNFIPSLGVAYLLTDSLKIRANYAEAFVMPAADELAADYTNFGRRYVGNPDLDPEESKTYEAGIDFSRAAFDSSLTYFHTDFDDKIVSVVTESGDSSWDNLGEATVSGVELEMSYDVGYLFSWDFQVRPYLVLTWLTEYEDEETGDDLQYTADLTASFGITVSDYNDLSADLNFSYIGEQDITDYENGTYANIDKGGFTVANFTIDKKIINTEKYGDISLRGEIQNIFDKDFEYVQGYPMPGRSFFIGMRYNY